MSDVRCRLYLISPPAIDLDRFSDDLRAALSGGDVACFQLRLKDASDADLRAAATRLMPLVQDAGGAFIVNDRADLAAELSADGVHIGQDDMSYDTARRLVGADAIVGVTCHDSRHLAMEAAEAGADYVAFGAFFATATKTPKTRATVDLLTWWQQLFEIPCVAIGGITVETCPPLIEAGADFIAVSAGIWGHPQGPQRAVAAFNEMCERHAYVDPSHKP